MSDSQQLRDKFYMLSKAVKANLPINENLDARYQRFLREALADFNQAFNRAQLQRDRL